MEAVTQRSHPEALTVMVAFVLVLRTQHTQQSIWIINTYVDIATINIISLRS
jgi:hypothetical protein